MPALAAEVVSRDRAPAQLSSRNLRAVV